MKGDSFFFQNKWNRRENRFIFKYIGKVNELNPLVDKLNFDKMSNIINFGVYIWLNSMLSVTPCKKCCIIKSMSSMTEFISLNIHITK